MRFKPDKSKSFTRAKFRRFPSAEATNEESHNVVIVRRVKKRSIQVSKKTVKAVIGSGGQRLGTKHFKLTHFEERKPFVVPISDAPSLAETIRGAALVFWNPNPNQEDFLAKFKSSERSWCKDLKHKAVSDPYTDHEPTISILTSSRFFSYCFLFTIEPAHVRITANSQLDQPLAKAAARELDKKKTRPDRVQLPQHTSVTRRKTVPYSSRSVPSCDPIRSQLASVCN
ncbi:hypothetical protein DY000_02050174 [Brassica cretica]|uniref:Uncharacterized protein n=1 Tax=Brassica cretica TaxID=69181 RepID=A0ABQ7F3H8_BRACR|nr:hypothetical protein DY000_02050174 [Brassica cretica]